MTPHPPIKVSPGILRDSAHQAAKYADLCPECAEEMQTRHCRTCGHREEQSSETRQGDLPPSFI